MTFAELAALGKSELEQQPCICVRCDACRGTGNIWVEDRYNEPFDDVQPCENCDQGVTEVCDRCGLLAEFEHEDYEQ